MSPICTPATEPSSSNSGSAAAKPANTSTPSASAWLPIHCTSPPSEMMKLPSLCRYFGIQGTLRALRRPSHRNSSRVTGTRTGSGAVRHSGSSTSSGPGSSTAPESMCAPSVDPFSRMQTLSSGLRCLRRMAVARPAGPAPMTATSYSITSRWAGPLLVVIGAGSFRLHADGTVETDTFAVEIGDFEDGLHDRGEFLGPAEPCGKRHLPAERVLDLRRHRGQHGRAEYPGSDRAHANAEHRELARNRQCHARNPCL